MAQTERLLLPYVGDVDHVGDVANGLQQILLAFGLQRLLQLEADVEVILNGGFAAARNDDDVLNAGMNASSTPYWIRGLSTSGSISLGCALVAGRKRVPSPAAGKTALRTFGISRFQLLYVV